MSEDVALQTLDEMSASLNHYTSRLRRPVSLSESFAWTPENIERATANALVADTNIQIPLLEGPKSEQAPKTQPRSIESNIIHYILLYVFHITLISIFETLFFFMYVSVLEDSGIDKTVNVFVDPLIRSCINYTVVEQQIANDILTPFINASNIINDGENTFHTRTYYNTKLLNKAWMYVGGCSGVFVLVLVYTAIRKIPIRWKSIIVENIGFVFILAMYEYIFFATIISPYTPISGNEIEANTIRKLQTQCHLLT